VAGRARKARCLLFRRGLTYQIPDKVCNINLAVGVQIQAFWIQIQPQQIAFYLLLRMTASFIPSNLINFNFNNQYNGALFTDRVEIQSATISQY
jgi:hypothetical protein